MQTKSVNFSIAYNVGNSVLTNKLCARPYFKLLELVVFCLQCLIVQVMLLLVL